jgi:uncharacterized GH25 family protein
MTRQFLLLLMVVVQSPASAHDFWVQPNAYWVNPEAVTPMTLQVGHGPYRQRSPIPLARISRFQAIAPNGTMIELRDQLRLGQPEKDGDLQFQNPGIYVVVLETDNRAQSHLPAIRFNDYLKVEGLQPALDYREQTHRTEADGAENYSRCAKSLVQVGSGSVEQTQVLKPVGLPLEIIPEKNPYAEPRSTRLPVRVLYEGRALAGALVKLTDLKHDEAPLEMQLTDATGHATFSMPQSGAWLLNVIWTKVLPRTRETDYETVFSSLSFGYTQQEQPQ